MESNEQIYLQEDSRQQANKHDLKDKYFKEHNIKVLRSKLPFGDYAILGKINLTIDTKKDALELFNCLTKDHIRFRNEIKLANEFNSGIVILIEEDDYYANLQVFEKWYRVPLWKSDGWKTDVNGKKYKTHSKNQPMSQVDVSTMVKVMKTMQEKYAVLFKFTTKERCGADIINILYNRYNDYNNYFQNKLKELRGKNDAK